jgi:hypothetical protein
VITVVGKIGLYLHATARHDVYEDSGYFLSGPNALPTSNLLTPWNIVLLKKLTVTQLVKKLTAFHGIRRFIIVFTGDQVLPVTKFILYSVE